MGVEFDKTDTLDGSGMLKTIGNRPDFVKKGQKWAEPVRKLIMKLGGSLGLNREYSGEYSSARLTAQLWRLLRRLGSARIWRAWTPDVFFLRARGLQWQNVQAARVGTSEFVWMKPTLWNDQNVFLTTMKIRIYPKNASFFWRTGLWYQLLLGETTGGGFETLRGDKTHCFISTTRSLQRLNKSYTPSLFLSSVSL